MSKYNTFTLNAFRKNRPLPKPYHLQKWYGIPNGMQKLSLYLSSLESFLEIQLVIIYKENTRDVFNQLSNMYLIQFLRNSKPINVDASVFQNLTV